jgi:hypothetical protein
MMMPMAVGSSQHHPDRLRACGREPGPEDNEVRHGFVVVMIFMKIPIKSW